MPPDAHEGVQHHKRLTPPSTQTLWTSSLREEMQVHQSIKNNTDEQFSSQSYHHTELRTETTHLVDTTLHFLDLSLLFIYYIFIVDFDDFLCCTSDFHCIIIQFTLVWSFLWFLVTVSEPDRLSTHCQDEDTSFRWFKLCDIVCLLAGSSHKKNGDTVIKS